MVTTKTLADVEAVLAKHVDAARHTTGRDITTQRTLALAHLVGDPQEALRTVHVAGTSGKTSTCYFMAALLGSTGSKVGLTVSPHMDSINERVQVDGQPLSEDKFCSYFNEFYALASTSPEMPTYFELMMVFALWVFQREKVDYAVVETGMGGLHDSSNIITRSDKLCIITDIGLDHTEVLGRTLAAIASQKAGIIWPHNTVVCYEQDGDVMAQIKARADKNQARLVVIEDTQPDELFRDRNWRLAREAFGALCQRDGIVLPNEEDIAPTRSIPIPGRLEIMHIMGRTVVLDGAHNEQKMHALIEDLRRLFPGMAASFLMAFKHTKDIAGPLADIADFATNVVATEFTIHQDTPFVSHEAEDIIRRLPSGPTRMSVTRPTEGWEKVLALDTPLVVVTGSLYLDAEIRQIIARQ